VFVVTQASTASTYIAPAGVAVGMALSFAMLRAWGFQAAAVSLAVAVTGVWNQLAMLAFPTVGLALLALTGKSSWWAASPRAWSTPGSRAGSATSRPGPPPGAGG
jgi:hypothetical protein